MEASRPPAADEELPPSAAVCDGGDLDCGSGLLLIIRNALAPLRPGDVLEVRSRERSVREDLPAWCRMVGHALVAEADAGHVGRRYFLKKKGDDSGLAADLERARSFAWRVRVRWKEGMSASVFARNHAYVVGQPASFDTEDAAPSAVEHLLGALGACLAVGFQWRASQRGIAVRQLEISLQAASENVLVFLGVGHGGHPGLAGVSGRLYVDADGGDEELASLWEETLARSPVAQTFLRPVPVQIDLRRA